MSELILDEKNVALNLYCVTFGKQNMIPIVNPKEGLKSENKPIVDVSIASSNTSSANSASSRLETLKTEIAKLKKEGGSKPEIAAKAEELEGK